MRMLAVLLLLVAVTGSSALAQGTATTATLLDGNVDSGFLFAPDFKFSEVNGDFATLAGAYGGWVVDKKFLIGGGVYTLANGGSSTDMTYGGGVFEYFVNQGSLVNISLRGLVGGGNASLGSTPFDFIRGRGIDGFPGGASRIANDFLRGFGPDLDFDFDFADLDFPNLGRASSTSFFVAEPEVNVILNISERFRFSVGGGYRFIAGAGRLQDRLDGFTANVALKMSFF